MGKWISTLMAIALSVAAIPAPAQSPSTGLAVSDPVAEAGSLEFLAVGDPASGATFRVFYDTHSERVARDSIPVLA